MTNFKVLAVSVVALGILASPAMATSYVEQVEMCKAAISDNDLANLEEYKVKFAGSKGGSLKRVKLELKSTTGGDDLTAKCSIRRGEVQEITLEA